MIPRTVRHYLALVLIMFASGSLAQTDFIDPYQNVSSTLEVVQAYLTTERARIADESTRVRTEAQKRRLEIAALNEERAAVLAAQNRIARESQAKIPDTADRFNSPRDIRTFQGGAAFGRGSPDEAQQGLAPRESLAPNVPRPPLRYLGNRCETIEGISSPGPVNPRGSPCMAGGHQGIVVDVFDLMKRLGLEADRYDDQAMRLEKLSADVFELMKKLENSPRPQNLTDVRRQIREQAKALSIEWKPS